MKWRKSPSDERHYLHVGAWRSDGSGGPWCIAEVQVGPDGVSWWVRASYDIDEHPFDVQGVQVAPTVDRAKWEAERWIRGRVAELVALTRDA